MQLQLYWFTPISVIFLKEGISIVLLRCYENFQLKDYYRILFRKEMKKVQLLNKKDSSGII